MHSIAIANGSVSAGERDIQPYLSGVEGERLLHVKSTRSKDFSIGLKIFTVGSSRVVPLILT